MPDDKTKELHEAQRDISASEAKLKYHLYHFGDYLAEREGYKEHKGMEALHYYLIQKYHWLPSQVMALNSNDLRFLFAEEMHDWTLPKDSP